MELGLKLLPQDDFIKVGAAGAYCRSGNKLRAQSLLQEALRDGSRLDHNERDEALWIRRSWYNEELNEKYRAAITARRYAEAKALLLEYTPRLQGGTALENYLAAEIKFVEAAETLETATKAARGGRPQEARSLLDQLLSRTDLPDSVRKPAEQLRRGLPKAR
jgi:hypothetical protein